LRPDETKNQSNTGKVIEIAPMSQGSQRGLRKVSVETKRGNTATKAKTKIAGRPPLPSVELVAINPPAASRTIARMPKVIAQLSHFASGSFRE
jgi:hypothetical protein